MTIELDKISPLGVDLARPECVLSTSNGRVYTSNTHGGATILEADGSQWELLAKNPGFDLHPNGICLMPDGSILVAHLGSESGGVFQLKENGDLKAYLTEVDGQTLPPTNYIHLDGSGRIWVSVSTRHIPRARGYNRNITDGFIIVVENGHARIVADNLGYANECIVHPDGSRLLVNETFSKRVSSFDITDTGNLTNKKIIAEFGHGSFPDGLAFDSEGGIWITSVVSNRVIRLSPDGKEQTIMIEDNDPDHVDWVETSFQAGEMGRPHVDKIKSTKLNNISSLAFGGPNLRKIFLGCLLGKSIYVCDSPIKGHPPSHWNFSGPQYKIFNK